MHVVRDCVGMEYHACADSGLDVESRHRVGSIGSVSSSQGIIGISLANNILGCVIISFLQTGGSYSPMSFRRNQNRIQVANILLV